MCVCVCVRVRVGHRPLRGINGKSDTSSLVGLHIILLDPLGTRAEAVAQVKQTPHIIMQYGVQYPV